MPTCIFRSMNVENSARATNVTPTQVPSYLMTQSLWYPTKQHDAHSFCHWPCWTPWANPSPLSFQPRTYHATFLPTIMPSCNKYLLMDYDFPRPYLHLETRPPQLTTGPTPSHMTIQRLGFCLSKAFADHIQYASHKFSDLPPAHSPLPIVTVPPYINHPG